MGKKLKTWKWPLGAAGAVVLFVSAHAIRTSPEFAEAQAAKQIGQQPTAEMNDTRAGDSADEWFSQRERGARPGMNRAGSVSNRPSHESRQSSGFRSSSHVS